MAFHYLRQNEPFPPVDEANPDGLLAIGGDLGIERLVAAYKQGIFPWYSEGDPILWWSPDPRFVLYPAELHIPRSLRSAMNQDRFRITFDQEFATVIGHCRKVSRPGQDGTWITPEVQQAYIDLHEAGYAHSTEVWDGENLAGGVYGVAVGKCFCGESMFSLVSDASKFGFVRLVRKLIAMEYGLINCQLYTHHLARFGAREIPRDQFILELKKCLKYPDEPGKWEDE